MEMVVDILKDLDWSPLIISLKTGVTATFFSFFLGIFAARKVIKMAPGRKAFFDGLLTLPMVLPPTVAGSFCCFFLAGGGHWVFCYMKNLILRWFRPGWAA